MLEQVEVTPEMRRVWSAYAVLLTRAGQQRTGIPAHERDLDRHAVHLAKTRLRGE